MKRSAENTYDNTKRHRSIVPSKVLHVRGLPSYCTEMELRNVVTPFGNVVKCLILPEKHQAFIQMESIDVAQDVLNNLEFSNPTIRSKTIYLQFSSRQEVEIKNNNRNGGAHNIVGTMGLGGIQGDTGSASSILLITVLNVTVPVTLENIYQICSPYGEVLKIVTFTKNLDFQALVQFGSVDSAINAKLFLEGKDMFQGCCHLRVTFSKRTHLIVKANDHRSRDFTVGGQQRPSDPTMQYGVAAGGLAMQPHSQMTPQGIPGGIGRNLAPGAFGATMGTLGGLGGMGSLPGGLGGLGSILGSSFPMTSMGGSNHLNSSVVLVNKLQEDKITPDILFTLFGVYGDVQRVKILFNKRDTALVQYSNPQQAALAIENLSGCPLFGSPIVVSKSKHTEVKLPRSDLDDSADGKKLTKDYIGSSLHRYRKGFMNPKNVNPPSQVLHVSNLYPHATEQELRNLFGNQQIMSDREPVVEFFKSSRKMAYVALSNVEDSVNALINLHGYKLGGEWGIRVSFSHKDPNSVRNSDTPDNEHSGHPGHTEEMPVLQHQLMH